MVLIRPEIKSAIFKGIGIYPTHYALRWNPSLKNPFRFDLLELQRCRTDGALVSCKNNNQVLLSLHPGHQFSDPVIFSFWELLKIQLRIIK